MTQIKLKLENKIDILKEQKAFNNIIYIYLSRKGNTVQNLKDIANKIFTNGSSDSAAIKQNGNCLL